MVEAPLRLRLEESFHELGVCVVSDLRFMTAAQLQELCIPAIHQYWFLEMAASPGHFREATTDTRKRAGEEDNLGETDGESDVETGEADSPDDWRPEVDDDKASTDPRAQSRTHSRSRSSRASETSASRSRGGGRVSLAPHRGNGVALGPNASAVRSGNPRVQCDESKVSLPLSPVGIYSTKQLRDVPRKTPTATFSWAPFSTGESSCWCQQGDGVKL